VSDSLRKPDGRRPGRPSHYDSRYEVVTAPTTGKLRCRDVALIKKNGAGDGFKRTVQVVRAWHARDIGDGKSGNPYELALQEAHSLRSSLDAYVQYLRRREA
jgi:hypothetical protein